MTDANLLQSYAQSHSQEAFSQLVARHAGWVHSAAVRMVRDPHLADDVTQAVFLLLAQNAVKLSRRSSLGGWLFKVTRYSCAHALRSRARREHHERQAAAMKSETAEVEIEKIWQTVAPALDERVASLRPRDREALLLRFYEQKSMAEIADAMGVSEDAAKKRVAKALGNLKNNMTRHGVVVPMGLLIGALISKTASAASVDLSASCVHAAAVHGPPAAHAALIAKGASKMLLAAKIKFAVTAGLAACVPVVVVTGMLVYRGPGHASLAAGTVNPTPPAIVHPADPGSVVNSPELPASNAGNPSPSGALAPNAPIRRPAAATADDANPVNSPSGTPSPMGAVRAAVDPQSPAPTPPKPDDAARAAAIQGQRNLRNVGVGLIQYANNHDGVLPPDFLAMLKGAAVDPESFITPASQTTLPDNWNKMTRFQQATWAAANTDFTYIGAGQKTASLDPSTVIAYEKVLELNGGVNLLFADSHVELFTKDQADIAIQASRKAMGLVP